MSSLKTISQFKSALQGGGARPNLFEVNMVSWPGTSSTGTFNASAQEEFQFLCKAAALPSSNITPIEIPFRGRTLKVAGDRTFDTWTITVINDENFRMRKKFEKWMNGISKLDDGTGILENKTDGGDNPPKNGKHQDQTIRQEKRRKFYERNPEPHQIDWRRIEFVLGK